MDKENENHHNESLEDMLNHMPGRKNRPRLNYSKFTPIGWQRLTDEQGKELQERIDRYLDINSSNK